MYHIFIFHLSVYGHLGCLHFVVILNRATVNMIKKGSLGKDVAFFVCMSRRSISMSTTILFLALLGIFTLISTVTIPVNTITSNK